MENFGWDCDKNSKIFQKEQTKQTLLKNSKCKKMLGYDWTGFICCGFSVTEL